jgi:uroporphyrinogen-III synthase
MVAWLFWKSSKMPQNKISILSTKEIEQALVIEADEKNIAIEISPFLKTEPIQSIEVQQEIETALTESLTVVFTSVNAVEAVAAELDGHEPAWKIFCVGYATKKAVEKYFDGDLIIGTADNATTLAELIVDDAEDDEIFFFCGDHRRPELPKILSANGFGVTEIVVYQTILLPHKLNKKYDGILFFSPSAVNSFFEKNNIGEQTVLFAIGETTAAELKSCSKNKIIISKQPAKRSLIETAISFYQQNPIYR